MAEDPEMIALAQQCHGAHSPFAWPCSCEQFLAALQGAHRGTAMTTHPLLAKVLAGAMRTTDHLGSEPSECGCLAVAEEYVASIPDHIAARLERALEQCRACSWPEAGPRHLDSDHYDYHPYQPLVTP